MKIILEYVLFFILILPFHGITQLEIAEVKHSYFSNASNLSIFDRYGKTSFAHTFSFGFCTAFSLFSRSTQNLLDDGGWYVPSGSL